mmetsp:Transcript_27694/g.94284  ORF Transcript_27694/g.94284 Transcript_27694/m.94284 type:complete len:205 (-) Transcript_27694:2012-2626(-)
MEPAAFGGGARRTWSRARRAPFSRRPRVALRFAPRCSASTSGMRARAVSPSVRRSTAELPGPLSGTDRCRMRSMAQVACRHWKSKRRRWLASWSLGPARFAPTATAAAAALAPSSRPSSRRPPGDSSVADRQGRMPSRHSSRRVQNSRNVSPSRTRDAIVSTDRSRDGAARALRSTRSLRDTTLARSANSSASAPRQRHQNLPP